MKNQYWVQFKQWCVVALWAMSMAMSARAQTVQPPVIQWQRVIENPSLSISSTGRVAKANDGGFCILTGTQLIRLSATGDIVWSSVVTGYHVPGSSYFPRIGSVPSLAATSDGGFAVLVNDESFWSVSKFSADGQLAWQKLLNYRYGDKYDANTNQKDMIATPDGGYLIVGNVAPGNQRFVVTRKLDRDGNTTWQGNVSYKEFVTLFVSRVTNAPNGGYVLVGQAANQSSGWAVKIDDQGSIVWQKLYPERRLLEDVIPSPYYNGLYIASGVNNLNDNVSNTLNLDADGSPGGGFISPGRGYASPSSIVSVPATNVRPAYHTVLDESNQNAGDFRLTTIAKSDQFGWAKTFGGSGIDVPQDLIVTNDGSYIVVGTTTSTDGDVQGKVGSQVATWIVKLQNPANTLALIQPAYNCQTGAITFNTTGGDGSPIVYTAPGISRVNATDNFGTIEAGLRGDPKPITITATQSGYTKSYTFDFGAFCSGNQPPQPPVTPPTTGALTLLAPIYDCGSGGFTFHSSGGNGSPIEYMAIGITAWTTNPNQFVDRESRTANDVKPFTLMARQNGQTVTYTWDLKAACGRANSRLQATQTDNPLTLTVLGNPVHEQLRVQIQGGNGQPVLLQLTDLTGRSIESRTVSVVDDRQDHTFELRQQGAGMLLLRASNGTQQRTVKVVKQ